MSGAKGRSGRRKSVRTTTREAMDENDGFQLEYMRALREIALNDKNTARERMDCLVYLTNRSQGAPKAQTDLRVKGAIMWLPEDYELLTRPKAEETKLISQYTEDKNAIQKQGSKQILAQTTHEEETSHSETK